MSKFSNDSSTGGGTGTKVNSLHKYSHIDSIIHISINGGNQPLAAQNLPESYSKNLIRFNDEINNVKTERKRKGMIKMEKQVQNVSQDHGVFGAVRIAYFFEFPIENRPENKFPKKRIGFGEMFG